MVGIRDVANEAGLAPATVSRYLNGQIVLRPETGKRIDDAVKKLNYRPNVIARRLSSGDSETLGLVTPDISYPLFSAIASAAEMEATRQGYQLAIFNSRNSVETELNILRHLETRQLDGIALLTNHTDTAAAAERINAVGKVVLIDEDVTGAEAPRIFADNEGGGRLVARHLIEMGHRDIAFIAGPEGMISAEERRAGFAAELAAAGLSLRPDWTLHGEYSEDHGAEAAITLLRAEQRPTAVFACADVLAVGVMRAARELGVALPGELSLVGFDDMNFSGLLHPPLTTVRQDAEVFGREGVRALLRLLKGEPTVEVVRVPVSLVARDSVASVG
ncbi:MAG: LacI family DNA-binding transcriptional regulator [Paracoccaceae bacterium]|nr:LacI family DNA-binding transcriptional regulator [Paracoccaceae bacterium]